MGPQSLEFGTRREWILSNGIGGFASSTILGMNTRRYHGLLVAALRPPGRRALLLSHLEDSVLVKGERHWLSSNFYPGVIHPDGIRSLTLFSLDPLPEFTYKAGPSTITKTIAILSGLNAVVVVYTLVDSPVPVELRVEPLVNFREYHGIRRGGRFSIAYARGGLWVVPEEAGASGGVYLSMGDAAFEATGYWYRDMEYPQERARGLEFREDHFNPGRFTVTLEPGDRAALYASDFGPLKEAGGLCRERGSADAATGETPKDPIAAATEEMNTRRSLPLPSWFPRDDAFASTLASTASSFLVCGEDGRMSVIAGYHWFEPWGRDTFISLPGLCLVTGRYREARSVFEGFAKHLRKGLIPNRITDPGWGPEYNSADASLWFVYALWKYLEYTDDLGFVNDMFPFVKEIIEWYMVGTDYNIGMSPNGLLWQGQPGMQLTWMDAKVGEWVITPRAGWTVEINGLWYNALRVAAAISRLLGPRYGRFGETCEATAARLKKSFDWLMWDDEADSVIDARGPLGPDRSLRPNQLIAMYLPFPLVDRSRASRALKKILDHLYTPLGVRTLAADDPRYRGRYRGGPAERDASYHQGTAWPWLIGPLVTALRRWQADGGAAGGGCCRQGYLGGFFRPFAAHLSDAGLGSISEVFDGDEPQDPGGCISQAWSVAEILRAYVEDYLEVGPAAEKRRSGRRLPNGR